MKEQEEMSVCRETAAGTFPQSAVFIAIDCSAIEVVMEEEEEL